MFNSFYSILLHPYNRCYGAPWLGHVGCEQVKSAYSLHWLACIHRICWALDRMQLCLMPRLHYLLHVPNRRGIHLCRLHHFTCFLHLMGQQYCTSVQVKAGAPLQPTGIYGRMRILNVDCSSLGAIATFYARYVESCSLDELAVCSTVKPL
jgi:hypothetical protein